jgi:hypothetical protein
MLRADTDLLLVSYAYDGVAHRPGHGADKQGMPSPRAWAGTILKPAETTILVVAAVDRAGAVAWTSEVQSPWRGALQRDMIGGLVEAALGDLLSRDPRRMEAECHHRPAWAHLPPESPEPWARPDGVMA